MKGAEKAKVQQWGEPEWGAKSKEQKRRPYTGDI